MYQFHFVQGVAQDLSLFPHVQELACKKNIAIQLNSFEEQPSDTLRIYYINDGKFEWHINGVQYSLFPGDTAIVLPGQFFGNRKGYLEIGTISWIHLNIPQILQPNFKPANWSGLSEGEGLTIGRLLQMNKLPVLTKLSEAGRILFSLSKEIDLHEIGYVSRFNQLIDELIVLVARFLNKQINPSRDFPKVFMQLEQQLRKDLSRQWTVEEMAAIAGMGTTLFNERVKAYSGFSPINYLINIRISEAIKLLKRKGVSITEIALDTGFYSYQHFSTTFKKLTGYTPGEFRRNNLLND